MKKKVIKKQRFNCHQNIHIKKTPKSISIKKLKLNQNGQRVYDPTQQWSFTKLDNTASSAVVTSNGISFGFPKITQTIYPNQSARLNGGWQMTNIPSGNMVHTVPSNNLLYHDVVSIPQIFGLGDSGSQLNQTILNNSNYPLVIEYNGKYDPPKIYRIKEQNILQQFSWGQLIQTVLGIAEHLLPIFL